MIYLVGMNILLGLFSFLWLFYGWLDNFLIHWDGEFYLKKSISFENNNSKFVWIFLRYISDSTVAVFCGILPLILPNSNPFKSKINSRLLLSFILYRWLEIRTNYSME
jgi:hypothetical protein